MHAIFHGVSNNIAALSRIWLRYAKMHWTIIFFFFFFLLVKCVRTRRVEFVAEQRERKRKRVKVANWSVKVRRALWETIWPIRVTNQALQILFHKFFRGKGAFTYYTYQSGGGKRKRSEKEALCCLEEQRSNQVLIYKTKVCVWVQQGVTRASWSLCFLDSHPEKPSYVETLTQRPFSPFLMARGGYAFLLTRVYPVQRDYPERETITKERRSVPFTSSFASRLKT